MPDPKPPEPDKRSRLVEHLLDSGVTDADAQALADAVDPTDERTIVVTIPGEPVAGVTLGLAVADGTPPMRVRVEAVRPAMLGLYACVGIVLEDALGPVDAIVTLGPAGPEVET